MVETRIADSPHRPVSVQTPQIRNGKAKRRKTVLPLLTISLWLASVSTSTAKPLPVPPPLASPLLSQHSPAKPAVPLQKLLYSGTQVSLNGQTFPAAWSQWQLKAHAKVRTLISDAAVTQLLGVELLNTTNAAKQPIQWFSQGTTTPLVLASWLWGSYRYLDVTDFAQGAGWQLQVNGNTLLITTRSARVQAIRQGRQPWGSRIVVDLDSSTPWQVIQQNQEWVVAIDAATDPVVFQHFDFSPEHQETKVENEETPFGNLLKEVKTTQFQTTIRLSLPVGYTPRVSTLPKPNRIVIDIRCDAMVERDILWSGGLRWRQQFVNLGASRFPVVWLEINPRAVGLVLKPIVSEPTTLVGIAPLLQTAQRASAVAAINGGFFNRNNKLPLGAIRRDGRWLSSPILNRGAIAWNNAGGVKIGRLRREETLITSAGHRLRILALNSGYIEPGIARYSNLWGTTYTPLSDNEIIVVVQNNQVTASVPGGAAGVTAFGIPPNGYLLALRKNNKSANSLVVGTIVRIESATVPDSFAHYPHILGAGPLLLQNRQIVLDPKAEGFSDAFIRETASRSAIGTTEEGTLLIVAVHNRAGGAGPSLAEITKIMQQLGCVDALNLDGGSSTSLYLGGRLLNRSPRTAARVHNGLGVFLQPDL